MKAADVPAVVSVHLESFPGFFLTFLGPRFLSELYAALVAEPTGIGFVREYGGISGFVAGTSRVEGFYERLIRERWWRFALASLGAVRRRPAVVPRLVRALNKPQQHLAHKNAALLMSIAVLQGHRGSGMGRALVRRFVTEAGSRGASSVILTTDRDGNETVNAFYRSMGFALNRTVVTSEGRGMNEYLLPIRPG